MTDGPTAVPETERRRQLATNLAALRERVAAAARAAGRSADDITVVAVTKTFPAADVRLLVELGVEDVGENRDQEAAPKARECADLDVRWHFVGQLQTNKARSVVRYASVVHSVDRLRLINALSRAVGESARPGGPDVPEPLRCLVQVQLDDDHDPERGGAAPADVPALCDAVADAQGLRLGGLMAVAPLGGEPAAAFARLAELAAELRANHPDATWLSAGMTEDLEQAVAFGATHVRVGRALLGERPSLR